jgi:uncharacterized protein YoxC
MLKEARDFSDLLGPWPILQFMFGVAVLGMGVYMIIRGISAKGPDLDEKRAEWEAYEQLRSIEENTAKIAENQRVMLENVRGATEQVRQVAEQMKALASAIWNRGV